MIIATAEHYDVLIQDTKVIRKPNGELLLAYFPKAVPAKEQRAAWQLFGSSINLGPDHKGSLTIEKLDYRHCAPAMPLVARAAKLLAREMGYKIPEHSEDIFDNLTIRVNVPCDCHRDGKDYALCAMSVIEGRAYDGCYLVYPDFRVAVDLRSGGILLCDIHEWHCNTEFTEPPSGYARMNIVMYRRP